MCFIWFTLNCEKEVRYGIHYGMHYTIRLSCDGQGKKVRLFFTFERAPTVISAPLCSVSDPHCLYADPDRDLDPAFLTNADPDSGKI
jgi:hypothetical protein